MTSSTPIKDTKQLIYALGVNAVLLVIAAIAMAVNAKLALDGTISFWVFCVSFVSLTFLMFFLYKNMMKQHKRRYSKDHEASEDDIDDDDTEDSSWNWGFVLVLIVPIIVGIILIIYGKNTISSVDFSGFVAKIPSWVLGIIFGIVVLLLVLKFIPKINIKWNLGKIFILIACIIILFFLIDRWPRYGQPTWDWLGDKLGWSHHESSGSDNSQNQTYPTTPPNPYAGTYSIPSWEKIQQGNDTLKADITYSFKANNRIILFDPVKDTTIYLRYHNETRDVWWTRKIVKKGKNIDRTTVSGKIKATYGDSITLSVKKDLPVFVSYREW